MFLRDLGEFLPMLKNHGVEFAVPYLLLKVAKQMQTLDKKTKNRNVKAILKQYPHYRDMLKEMRKNLDEIL
jgi:glyceraldehyde-3-phosphate dehydrogenase/erythrose-4-phosphate dehydrogenase